jgi:hypothetical protein
LIPTLPYMYPKPLDNQSKMEGIRHAPGSIGGFIPRALIG